GPLRTRWAADVNPSKALPEYPRPQLVRKDWQNLNGLWDYSVQPADSKKPGQFDGRILVPFPIESALSGVMKPITEKDRIWYRTSFSIPKKWKKQHLLLHFGAVDFEAHVWVNGREVGQHRGGYDGFSFDITSSLTRGKNELIVSAWDPGDAGTQPRGKQVRKPDQGIFYTGTSGIWQTVWIEPVPEVSIAGLKILPDIDVSAVHITPLIAGDNAGAEVEISAYDGTRQIAKGSGKAGSEITLAIKDPKLWSPDSPTLYNLSANLVRAGKKTDSVSSYFGMRKVALGQDDKGTTRIFLNNKPFFMVGPLDQGFWPDGLYTAPTDEALRYDIEITRKLGFNMARKHVKVEPDRWYYWTDKLGLLVWQDMPSGDRFISPRDPDIKRTPESAKEYETELKAMIDGRYNHPSIVMWVVFNEGWGQFDTPRITQWTKEYDPSRLVDNTSGWADREVGDVNDMHKYPGPGSPTPEQNRAAVLGEFGGLGFKVDGHTWAGKTWGYQGMSSIDKLTRQYVKLMTGVWELKKSPGLSAAVYTQTTDVEYEGNGLLTYDRAIVKMDLAKVAAANQGNIPPPPRLTEIVPTGQKEGSQWSYTTAKPASNWFETGFSAADWSQGPSGFGTQGTPGSVVRTEWKSSDIWLRRNIEIQGSISPALKLMVHHDEDAEIYINGVLATKLPGHIGNYDDVDISPEALKAMHPGTNVLAVHCHQTTGGQYIDVGLVKIEP
ncbi:MAG: beta-galactosidase/beta-glucuronidase, partial [Verrucomicrobiales bacterium]|nr:beta-galactosidase/beta-glucuronidase [Verrucomicrobiales bacterium]